MNAPGRRISVVVLLLLGAARAARAAEPADLVAVYAATSPGYARAPLPTGGFRPETYAFGEGGLLGGTMRDPSIDRLRFPELARLLAPALAARDYRPASDPRKTDLLVVVYWGLTPSSRDQAEALLAQGTGLAGIPPTLPPMPPGIKDPNGSGDPGMSGANLRAEAGTAEHAANDLALDAGLAQQSFANEKRDQQSAQSARLLGYLPALRETAAPKGTALDRRHQDLVDEVEDGRYYVVLLAYDFRTLAQQRKRKLMWEVRFSVRARGHDFSQDVAAMAENAARYFGRDSGGLKRDSYDPRVEIGALRVVEDENAQK